MSRYSKLRLGRTQDKRCLVTYHPSTISMGLGNERALPYTPNNQSWSVYFNIVVVLAIIHAMVLKPNLKDGTHCCNKTAYFFNKPQVNKDNNNIEVNRPRLIGRGAIFYFRHFHLPPTPWKFITFSVTTHLRKAMDDTAIRNNSCH